MDRFRLKAKKEKPIKHHDKAKPQAFVADVKTIKENLKIKEILKTVKINSSMRIKAPRGSKVMSNKDLSEANEHDSNEEEASAQSDSTSATYSPMETNTRQTINSDSDSENKLFADADNNNIDYSKDIEDSIQSIDDVINSLTVELNGLEANELKNNEGRTKKASKEDNFDHKARYSSHEPIPRIQAQVDTLSCLPTINSLDKRTRKLSLDQTMLSRRPSLSQSDMNLHLMGKSPLERKSSFFRKKMDSFLKNTSEIFKRQSLSKASELPGLSRRGALSCSLQSLHDTTNLECTNPYSTSSSSQEMRVGNGSVSSLNSSSTMAYSSSSYAGSRHGARGPDTCTDQDRDSLGGSQPLGDWSESVHSLNEAHIQELMLNSRAISMNSGLDSAKGTKRRPSSLANRVTWLASEGLTNYLRRVIQDEKSKAVQPSQSCHSFSDLNTMPAGKGDGGGRRLSYQKAVSGEDPAKGANNSFRRRRPLPEHHESGLELTAILEQFSHGSAPPLDGFFYVNISDHAWSYLESAETPRILEEYYDWKSLPPNEQERQAVIKELIYTEVDHIRHLTFIVEVFMAAAHALQNSGRMLDVDTSRLFSNMPDVLNASLSFWQATFFPMITEAIENKTIFNTDLMYAGFCEFNETFKPYRQYLSDQNKRLDYLRSLANDTEFEIYLNWCNKQKFSKRLQLWDLMVKPMQRLTKYPIILQRIISHTDMEPQRASLREMETFAKTFVTDTNRSIRQKEEFEKMHALIEIIDVYDVDFKEDELDRMFKAHSSLNLRAPMLGCLPNHSRSLIYEGNLRFKDNIKEFDARVFLLTDMLLVCKKINVKGSPYLYRLARMKFMVKKLVYQPVFSRTRHKELVGLAVVMLDDVQSACAGFMLSEPSAMKEPGSHYLKIWEQKLKEARITYDLAVWLANHPSVELSEAEVDTISEQAIARSSIWAQGKHSSEDSHVGRDAVERVAAMTHRHSLGASTENDYSQASMYTDSFDAGALGEPGPSGWRTPGLRHHAHRASYSGSSRNSRISSFQHSTSAASHDEPQAPSDGHLYMAGSSVEHIIPPRLPNEDATSITVNVVEESESEQPSTPPPAQLPASPSKQQWDTLPVQRFKRMVLSLPDLNLDRSPSPPPPIERRGSPTPTATPTATQTASEYLYQSHNELLRRNQLMTRGPIARYLTPTNKGKSYPPPSPTRASLKRGMALSYSSKNPPLFKMGHVNSHSQVQGEAGPSTSAAAGTSIATGLGPMAQGARAGAGPAPPPRGVAPR